MATPNVQNGGAVAGVRLTDIPLTVRRRYGRYLLDAAIRDLEPMRAVDFAADLHRAVEDPSDRVYWLPAQAVLTKRKEQGW